MITRPAHPSLAVPAAAASDKTQDFAHRIVEFADYDACCKFFLEKAVAFDVPTAAGWSLLMRICACGRAASCGYISAFIALVASVTRSFQ